MGHIRSIDEKDLLRIRKDLEQYDTFLSKYYEYRMNSFERCVKENYERINELVYSITHKIEKKTEKYLNKRDKAWFSFRRKKFEKKLHRLREDYNIISKETKDKLQGICEYLGVDRVYPDEIVDLIDEELARRKVKNFLKNQED